MTKCLKLRDPIHGFIELEGRECDLINLDLFQRLRGIRQLAFANLVYQGALHTRFDHSLGVFHLAKKITGTLEGFSKDDKEILCFAALLHDVGHGPFSHVSEDLLDRYAQRDKLSEEGKKDKIHEIITNHLITENKQIQDILGKRQCEQVAKLLASGYSEPFLKSLISGPLDVDKQDYLLRDSYFCGVQYGMFDFHQLQRSLLIAGSDSSRDLMIKADSSIHAVEQFILAKYYMTTMVYGHKVRMITDQMIIRAIILGIEIDGIEEMKRLYNFDGSKEFYENYLGWNDNKFLLKFGEEGVKEHKSKLLIDRLTKRRLLKRVFSSPITDFSMEKREILADIEKKDNMSLRKNIEGEIASVLEKQLKAQIDPDLTILHAFKIKSVKEMARNDEAGILVYDSKLFHHKLEDKSTLLQSINEKLSERIVEIYAPVEWESHSARDQTIGEIKPLLREVIQNKITAGEG